MKKATLTIGLFSLVMVLTSFNTTEPANDIIVNNTTVGIDGSNTSGAMTGVGGRKPDYHIVNNQSEIKNTQSGFANINQSLGGNKKID